MELLICLIPIALVGAGLLMWWWQNRQGPQGARPDGFVLDVVGESHYQVNLLKLCGKRKGDGEDRWFNDARLVAEPDNPVDANAVRVEIRGLHVGYLTREDAAAYVAMVTQAGPLPVRAHVRGGWYDPAGDHGHYGVRVELML